MKEGVWVNAMAVDMKLFIVLYSDKNLTLSLVPHLKNE